MINQEQRKYFCFAVGNSIYHFNCLPYDLDSAPCIIKTLKSVAALGREQGMQLIVYINNILLLAESEQKSRDEVSGLVYLLKCLAFTINTDKSILEPLLKCLAFTINTDKSILKPAQSREFLGFTINIVTMELSLPAVKLKKIWAESRKLLQAGEVLTRTLSRLIGRMDAPHQVIPPAPLFYRHLQMDLIAALRASNQDYESSLSLSLDSKEELVWWDTRMSKWKGKSILMIKPEMVI